MVVTVLPATLETACAGADGLAVDMHRACAAQRHAAAELGAGHAQRVAQNPQQRHLRLARPRSAALPFRVNLTAAITALL